MTTLPHSFETAVETFKQSSDMSQAEAEVFVARELAGWSRTFTAERLEKSVSTVDNQHQRAKQKGRMPEITKVESHKRASDDRVVDIWFANDARLRYRATDSDPERNTILEETFRADDPHSVWDTADLAIEPDDLHEVALESISRYLEDYRNDFEAAKFDWANLFEALTCHEP